jgi:GT2 family glycosyltransferase
VRATSGDSPDVVAVVLNFRAPHVTVDCVESLLASRGVSMHVLVVDNASGDDSGDVLVEHFANHPYVTLHLRTVNDGYTGGNNVGVVMARRMGARYALVINNDTIVEPDCVARLVAAADADPQVALVAPQIFFGEPADRLWFGGGRFSLWHGRPRHVGFRQAASAGWREARDLPFASGCALLVRFEAVDAIGGTLFDPTLFTYAEDLDLSLRMRAAGWRLRYEPRAVLWHLEGVGHKRVGGQALRFYLNTRNLVRVVARHARWYHWPILAPVFAVDVIGRFCAIALRDRDPRAFAAVLRGVAHAVTGGRHPIELSR